MLSVTWTGQAKCRVATHLITSWYQALAPHMFWSPPSQSRKSETSYLGTSSIILISKFLLCRMKPWIKCFSPIGSNHPVMSDTVMTDSFKINNSLIIHHSSFFFFKNPLKFETHSIEEVGFIKHIGGPMFANIRWAVQCAVHGPGPGSFSQAAVHWAPHWRPTVGWSLSSCTPIQVFAC